MDVESLPMTMMQLTTYHTHKVKWQMWIYNNAVLWYGTSDPIFAGKSFNWLPAIIVLQQFTKYKSRLTKLPWYHTTVGVGGIVQQADR